jgi:hypothetical protein
MKNSATTIRAQHFLRGTKPRAKQRAFLLAADRLEEVRVLLDDLESDMQDWAANIERARDVANAVSAVRPIASTDRFRRLQQLADELVGIWCVEDGLR